MRDPPASFRGTVFWLLCGAVAAGVCATGVSQEPAAVVPVDETLLLEPSAMTNNAEMPDHAAMQRMIDQAVAARLAGIPRPRYIPATDLVPPQGVLIYRERPRSNDFPFALALGGFIQLQ
jgi:hypothetical protein